MAEDWKSNPAVKVNKTLKERRALVDAPVPSYNKAAVNKSIASSTRSGKKIGSSEGKAIHSLLKGRYAYGGPIKLKDCEVSTAQKNPKHKKF